MVKSKITRVADCPPPEIRLDYGEVKIDNKADALIRDELYDGVCLVAKYTIITLFLSLGKENQRILTITIPQVCDYRYVCTEFYKLIIVLVYSHAAWAVLYINRQQQWNN